MRTYMLCSASHFSYSRIRYKLCMYSVHIIPLWNSIKVRFVINLVSLIFTNIFELQVSIGKPSLKMIKLKSRFLFDQLRLIEYTFI